MVSLGRFVSVALGLDFVQNVEIGQVSERMSRHPFTDWRSMQAAINAVTASVIGRGAVCRLLSTRSRKLSPHRVLKLEPHATRDEIRAQFRAMAKQFHPDVNR